MELVCVHVCGAVWQILNMGRLDGILVRPWSHAGTYKGRLGRRGNLFFMCARTSRIEAVNLRRVLTVWLKTLAPFHVTVPSSADTLAKLNWPATMWRSWNRRDGHEGKRLVFLSEVFGFFDKQSFALVQRKWKKNDTLGSGGMTEIFFAGCSHRQFCLIKMHPPRTVSRQLYVT